MAFKNRYGLTELQMRFCDEYIKDTNGTRAYKAAYPHTRKDSTAAVHASQLLKREEIKAYIDKRLKEMHDQRTADAKEVLEYLTSVMRGESRSEVLVFVGKGRQEAIVKGPDESQRLRAAELLGKRYGMFSVNVNMGEKGELAKLDELIKYIDKEAAD